MSPPPTSAEEVWNATRVHSKLFSDAAERIGLTPAEYKEFRSNLLDGKAVYVKLPQRVDAMSGNRRGSVYAVKNAVMNEQVMGWRVDLADGNVVYIPQICGNISLLRHAAVAVVPRPHKVVYVAHHKKVRYVQAIATVPSTPVVVTPPVTPVAPEAPPAAAQVVTAGSSTHGSGFLYFIPVAVGGIIAGLVHGNTSPAPPCKDGSNSQNVCSK
jgi:putative component of toxin-antitoxin plasmid stabilization module